jgi:hypothetical protein
MYYLSRKQFIYDRFSLIPSMHGPGLLPTPTMYSHGSSYRPPVQQYQQNPTGVFIDLFCLFMLFSFNLLIVTIFGF